MGLGWDNMNDQPLLWASANTLPDIIGGIAFVPGNPVWREWVDAGLVRSLPNDLSPWPSLDAIISQSFVQDLNIDGQTWFFPRVSVPAPEYDALARGLINRKDWREQLNIPVPVTEEDFINMWQAFVDNAAVLPGAADIVYGLLPGIIMFTHSYTFVGHGIHSTDWVWQDGGMIRPGYEEQALPALSFLRRLWREGLIDPDFITNTTWQANQEFALGRAGTIIRQVVPVHLNNIHIEWTQVNPDIDFVSAVEILEAPRVPGITPVYMKGSGFWSETMFSSRLDDATMNKIMYFFDWLASEEGMNTMMFGFEGQDWEYQNGEVVMLTPLNEDGNHLEAGDLYQFAAGGMRDLAVWSADMLMWTNPNIPQGIRDMSNARLQQILTGNTTYMWRDIRVAAISIDEIAEMGLPPLNDIFVEFLTDTSNTSDEDLWQQLRDRINSVGYPRAKELMTAAAREILG
jgi:putative aldouronate transport system substrate-binding protein